MSDSKTEKPAEEKKVEEKKEKSSNGIAKNILLSTIGTTISIILTFGTTSLVDKYQAAQSRKLFAMTIIHEIDQDIERVRAKAAEEYELFNIVRYIRNQSDSVPTDSLKKYKNLVSPYLVMPEFSKSNEQIFNSTQNTWSTIDNNIFISNVQDYYRLRSNFESALKEDTCFLPYVSVNDFFASVWYNESIEENVRRFNIALIEYKASRRIIEYNTLLRYKSVNEENKILMDISDQDLEEFAKRTADARNVSKNDLIGSWINQSYEFDLYLSYNKGDVFSFYKNNTLTIHGHTKYSGAKSGIGDILLYYTVAGEWKIEGDSVVMNFPTEKFEVTIDDNDFYYSNVSQWRETCKKIEDSTYVSGKKQKIFWYLSNDLGTTLIPPYNTATVGVFIDRFGRSITMRNSKMRNEPKRFERTDPSTIPTYNFVKHPATEQEIVGKWAWYEDANTIQMGFDHGKDHSLAIWKVYKEQNPDLFSGTFRVKRNLSGEWKLENGSLVYYYDTKTLDLTIDDSKITYSPDKADLVSNYKKMLTNIYTQRTLQSPREAYQAITNAKRMEMIDKNGNMMFLYK